MRQFNVPEIYWTVAAKHDNDAVAGEDLTSNLVRLANLTCHKLGAFPIDTRGENPYTPPPNNELLPRRPG